MSWNITWEKDFELPTPSKKLSWFVLIN
uniref:Uncharacterized protein n=1 Tax=Arundo donax TaxID=35708 RepID=A0A0A9AD86_ARUDO